MDFPRISAGFLGFRWISRVSDGFHGFRKDFFDLSWISWIRLDFMILLEFHLDFSKKVRDFCSLRTPRTMLLNDDRCVWPYLLQMASSNVNQCNFLLLLFGQQLCLYRASVCGTLFRNNLSFFPCIGSILPSLIQVRFNFLILSDTLSSQTQPVEIVNWTTL